ncbi:hypothetical protein EH244_29445 [Variovorax beijingensis]|uniref:Uncharacterized protein n=1 Tax=Variovorax beijingensis TaxID=2496117 RepID=A0A3P3E3Y6_9BURK|nr:hypothetical protein EH244_29445 [Variovorax beijingensis]
MAATLPPPVTSPANPPLRLLEVEAGAGAAGVGAAGTGADPAAGAGAGADPGAGAGVSGAPGADSDAGAVATGEAGVEDAAARADAAAPDDESVPPPPPQATSKSDVNKAPAARDRCNSWFVCFNFFMVFFMSRCPGMKDDLSKPRAISICTLRADIAFLSLLVDASALCQKRSEFPRTRQAGPAPERHICRFVTKQSNRTNACCPASRPH